MTYLTPEEVDPRALQEWQGRVIQEERPFVKLLSAPVYYEEEQGGVMKGEWRALAQVDTCVCVIEVKMRRLS